MTTEVMSCVEGAAEEAETIEVTTSVVDGSTVVVLSPWTDEDIEEATAEEKEDSAELIEDET